MDLGPAELGDTDSGLEGEGEDILQLVRIFRANCNLPPHVGIVQDNFLLPTADAFDAVDHFILATPRLADDPPGLMALRHWLEQGGKLWVMLDMVDPDALARLLGEDSGFQVVDRTSLTTVRIDGREVEQASEETPTQELEQPVNFVRVVLTPKYKVLRTVNGWPALCTRPVGRGKLVMTTLGARGWFRPRKPTELQNRLIFRLPNQARPESDPPSPYPEFPDLPFPLPALDTLTEELQPLAESNPFPRDAFEPLLMDEIGYSIIGVGTAGVIFGIFLAVMLAVGIVLYKARRSELLAWLGPAVALAATGIFLALGEASRRGVPPTVAVAQMVNVNPRADEQPVTGVFALFRPDAGPLPVSSTRGGLLDFDMSGLEGQTRQMVMTDLDAWHWENLSLPAGLRKGTFRYSARMEKPVSAVAEFGSKGVEGKLAPGPFQGLADALIQTPVQRSLAVEFRADGTFTAGDGDILAPGQYLSATVLTDRQQRRQTIYGRLLTETKARNPEERSMLMAWAEPAETPFTFAPGMRTVGSALLSIPLEFERTPPDTAVTVPSAFIALRRIIQGVGTRPTLEGQYAVEQHLRFQIPSSVLPMKVERARLLAKVNAPLRRFTVSGKGDGGRVELLAKDGPIDTLPLEIVREDLLRLDERGGLHLDIAVSDRLGRQPAALTKPGPGGKVPQGEAETEIKWSIESLELEVIGRTLPEK
jgi:hypothetical protein